MAVKKVPTGKTFPVTIPATSEVPISYRGNHIRVIDTTGNFKVMFNGQSDDIELRSGLGYKLADGEFYDMVTFKNESGAAITVTVFLGYGDVQDSRLTINSGATINVQQAAGTTLVVENNVNAGQMAVTSVPTGVSTLVAISNGNINGFFLQNTGGVNVYYGPANNASTLLAQGQILGPMEVSTKIDGNFAVYATTLSGTGEIRRVEQRGI